MATTRGGRRATSLPEHPIDVKARELRGSSTPRQDFADAVDDLLGEWSMGGLAKPIEVFTDHVRTLARAATEAEKRLGRRLSDKPVIEPWEGS